MSMVAWMQEFFCVGCGLGGEEICYTGYLQKVLYIIRAGLYVTNGFDYYREFFSKILPFFKYSGPDYI